jgi:outer membrane protein, heavy metal efflux system
MKGLWWLPWCLCVWTGARADAQTPLTWEQVKAKFEAANPTLRAGQLSVQETRTQEITAYLRPNPNMTGLLDQIDPFSRNGFFPGNPYRPLGTALPAVTFDYLHERGGKRELRL